MNLFRVFIRSVGFLGGTFLLSNPKLDLVINESVSNVGFDLKNISEIAHRKLQPYIFISILILFSVFDR